MRTLIRMSVATVALCMSCGGPPLSETDSPADDSATITSALAGPPGSYPNALLTPGDTLPVTAAQVCVPGYTKGVRNVPASVRAEVYKRYGLTDVSGQYELDHFVALELGGSNAVTNLWPEPYAPAPGAHEKDTTENYLHKQMCQGKMTLAQVQAAIRTDWYAVYHHATGH